MQIPNYITDLLYRYDCVIVPDFGAFISKRIPATLDPNQHIITPPRKQLSFNEQITNNDGLLTNYIASKEEISYEEANKTLQLFVTDLKKEISERSSFNFPKIGSFKMNIEGNLIFEPNEEVNYLKEAFGLDEVAATEITREVIEQADVEEDIIESEVEAKKFNYSGIKYAASIALFVGVGGFLFWNQYKNAEANQYTEANRLVQEHIQEATYSFDISSPLPSITLNVDREEVALKEVNKPYHIIAGAFRELDNANKLIAKLTKKGFEANYIGANKYGLHQVVYQSFVSKVEAVQFLNKIKRTENKTAWILTKQND